MDVINLQKLTKAYHKNKQDADKKRQAANKKHKDDAFNDEKALVKKAVLSNLDKISRKDLEDSARTGCESYTVYKNDKYRAKSKMCSYMNRLAAQINEEMSLPARLEQSTFRNHATHHFMIGDYVDVCTVRYTWKESEDWWHKFTK